MKKAILIYAVLLMSSFSFATSKNEEASTGNEYIYSLKHIEIDMATEEEKECTVEYTNSDVVKFTSTASTCTEAYENVSMHIEAS